MRPSLARQRPFVSVDDGCREMDCRSPLGGQPHSGWRRDLLQSVFFQRFAQLLQRCLKAPDLGLLKLLKSSFFGSHAILLSRDEPG